MFFINDETVTFTKNIRTPVRRKTKCFFYVWFECRFVLSAKVNLDFVKRIKRDRARLTLTSPLFSLFSPTPQAVDLCAELIDSQRERTLLVLGYKRYEGTGSNLKRSGRPSNLYLLTLTVSSLSYIGCKLCIEHIFYLIKPQQMDKNMVHLFSNVADS